MPHVLIAGKIHDAGIKFLEAQSEISFEMIPEISLSSYAPRAPLADAILIRTQPLTAEVIANSPRLKIVSRHGVGYDAVDVAALNARGIPLCIVGDVNSRAVAEHTLMLMLAAARRAVLHDQACRTGHWNERNRFDATELDGKRLLILGFGRIGRRVSQLAQAFGMSVSAFDPHVPAELIRANGCDVALNIAGALAAADYVTLHLPATKTPVIGAKELSLMKPGAILVNAARGELIDELALDQALRSNHLRHAALDVLSQEPPSPDHSLLGNSKVTLSHTMQA